MFRSLRSQLTVILIGLATLPLLLVTIINGQRSFADLQRETVKFQRERTRQVATEIDAFVEHQKREIQLTAEVRDLGNLDTNEQYTALNRLLRYNLAIDELVLLNIDGAEVVRISRTEMYDQNNLGDRSDSEEFLSVYTNNEDYYSPISFDPIRGPRITLAMPVNDPLTHEMLYVLVGVVRIGSISDLLLEMDLDSSEDVYIVDANDYVIAHRDPYVVLNETTYDLPATDGRAVGLSGDDVILATTQLIYGEQKWTIVSERLFSEASALAYNLLLVTTIVASIALIAAIGLVILTVRQIVTPIEKLTRTATMISAGDTTQRAHVTGRNEVSTLAEAFNTMTAQLSDLIGTLEERIAEQTRDLKVASDVSRQATTVLDVEELLPQLAELTHDGFELFSVAIYLYDDETEELNLAVSAGANQVPITGNKLVGSLDREGIVSLAASKKEGVVINDVDKFSPAPLFGGAKSEMALPMLIGNRLIGVIDLQSEQINRFSEDDVEILTTLAEQMAIALRNAQLYEEAAKAREIAEQANRTKSTFLANMSHELRTPLNAILNFTEIVSEGVIGDINPEQQDLLKQVIESAEHLLSLINDILDLTKIEVGMMDLFIEEVDPNKLLQSVSSVAKGLVKDASVVFYSDFDENLPTISGDRRRLRQVLLNLVSNAIKFTPDGSVTLRAVRDNGQIHISVIDTGIGISEEEKTAIFEAFVQAKHSLKVTGTGLGLPISKHFVEAHGGKIWMESQLNVGSTFHFTIPITPLQVEKGEG